MNSVHHSRANRSIIVTASALTIAGFLAAGVAPATASDFSRCTNEDRTIPRLGSRPATVFSSADGTELSMYMEGEEFSLALSNATWSVKPDQAYVVKIAMGGWTAKMELTGQSRKLMSVGHLPQQFLDQLMAAKSGMVSLGNQNWRIDLHDLDPCLTVTTIKSLKS